MLFRSNRDTNYFYIDWWLLNHCNFNCSYCADIIKNGSIDLPNINHCIDMVKLICEYAKQNNKKTNFNIVGGEITQWPFTKDLLQEIKYYNGLVTIRSNASCSSKDWQELIAYTDVINLEYHPEFTGESHFILQISTSLKMEKRCHIVMNMSPEDWTKSENFYKKLKYLYPNLPIHKKILFDDPAINKEIKKNYSNEQIENLKSTDESLTLFTNNKEEFTNYNNLLIEEKNIFIGKFCNIGIEQIIIDAWGRVARGHCRNDGHIGRLGKGIIFPTDPTICGQSSCRNAFDIQATKFS